MVKRNVIDEMVKPRCLFEISTGFGMRRFFLLSIVGVALFLQQAKVEARTPLLPNPSQTADVHQNYHTQLAKVPLKSDIRVQTVTNERLTARAPLHNGDTLREVEQEKELAEEAAYDAAVRLQQEEELNARFREKLAAAGMNADATTHNTGVVRRAAARSGRSHRPRFTSRHFEVIDGSLSAVSGNEMADGVLNHVKRDPMEDGILNHFKSEAFNVDTTGPISGKRSTYEVIDGSLAAANDRNHELVNGVLSNYKQSKHGSMGVLAQVQGEDRDGSLAATKDPFGPEGALAHVPAEDPVGLLHAIDGGSSKEQAHSNAVGVLSTIDAQQRPFRKEEERLQDMQEEHQEFEKEEGRLNELDKITRAEKNGAEKRKQLERLKRWEREVRELGEMQTKKLNALREELYKAGDYSAADQGQDEAGIEEANAARRLRAETARTASRRIKAAARPAHRLGKLDDETTGEDAEAATTPANTGAAEEPDDSDIGWVKTKWTWLGWTAFVVMGPIVTAAVTGLVSIWAGPIAGICTCIIMIAMDIASYYYSWYTL